MERLLNIWKKAGFALGAVGITVAGILLGINVETLLPMVAGFWIAQK